MFWPEDAPECTVTVFARQEAIGLCGTGLTIEPRAWESGLEATAYSERLGGEEGDQFWYLLIYSDTPVCCAAEYSGPAALWEEYGAEIEEILGTASFGGEAET